MVSLEDDFSDIISKARRGLGLSVNDLARMSGLSPKQIESLETAQYSIWLSEQARKGVKSFVDIFSYGYLAVPKG